MLLFLLPITLSWENTNNVFIKSLFGLNEHNFCCRNMEHLFSSNISTISALSCGLYLSNMNFGRLPNKMFRKTFSKLAYSKANSNNETDSLNSFNISHLFEICIFTLHLRHRHTHNVLPFSEFLRGHNLLSVVCFFHWLDGYLLLRWDFNFFFCLLFWLRFLIFSCFYYIFLIMIVKMHWGQRSLLEFIPFSYHVPHRYWNHFWVYGMKYLFF